MRPRVGFLGVGWIGRHRMQAMLATGSIDAVAIADTAAGAVAVAVAEVVTLAPGARIAASLDDMLAMGLDGVVIATPSALHADQSIRALAAGAAVFCQKPVGRNAAEVRAVVAAARAADRLLAVDFSYRLTDGMRRIKSLVEDGSLGRIQAIDLVFHNAYGPDKPWFYDRAQSGGGCVMDLGVHLIDLALWMLDFPEVRRVSSSLFADGVPLTSLQQVEDLAFATIDMAGGSTVRLACSWRLHAGRDAVIGADVYGTTGGASLRNIDGSFYDFRAQRFTGTTRETVSVPPDDWGGRAAARWSTQLAMSRHFDANADTFVTIAETMDRIYADVTGE